MLDAMNGPMLPSFKWLLAGALAAGVWVVRHDMSGPRPPEKVPPAKSASAASPKPFGAVLPKTALRPPPKPSRIATGSIAKPDKFERPEFRTTARVRIRGKADVDAPVLFTLQAGQAVRELARSGKWRLVSAAGRKGWVHVDYLAAAKDAAPRPKALVPMKTAAKPAKPPVKKP